jgi:hypothetical protein
MSHEVVSFVSIGNLQTMYPGIVMSFDSGTRVKKLHSYATFLHTMTWSKWVGFEIRRIRTLGIAYALIGMERLRFGEGDARTLAWPCRVDLTDDEPSTNADQLERANDSGHRRG